MRLSSILITVLLISGFAIGMSGFYGEVLSRPEYAVTDVEDWASLNYTQRVFNMTSDISSITNSSQVENPTVADVVLGIPSNLLTGTYRAGMLAMAIPNIFQSLIFDVGTKVFGVPSWLMDLSFGIILILVLAGLIYFITSRFF